MNRLAHWMMRLYPARWRRRYGDELNALLDDAGADARVLADLLKGGVRMQFSTWSFAKLAVVLGFAGLVAGTGIAWLLPSEYTSKATLQITPSRISEDQLSVSQAPVLNELIQYIQMDVLSRTSLARIIENPALKLYAEEQPLIDVIETMKRNVQIQIVALPGAMAKRASAFDVRFSYPDRFKAQQTVQALIDAFMVANAERWKAAPSGSENGSLEVLDYANLPVSPAYPNRSVLLLCGLLSGVFLAAIWRAIQRGGIIARRFTAVAIAFGLAGAAMAFLAERLDLVPDRYVSAATLRTASAEQIPQLVQEVLSRTSLSRVINDPRLRLYARELRTVPLEDVIATMKEHIQVTQYGQGSMRVFRISFEYPDRYKAQATVSRITTAFSEAAARLYPQAGAPRPITPANLDILDAPSLPITPTKPNRYMIAGAGFVWGVVVAGIVAAIRRRWKPEGDLPINAVNS